MLVAFAPCKLDGAIEETPLGLRRFVERQQDPAGRQIENIGQDFQAYALVIVRTAGSSFDASYSRDQQSACERPDSHVTLLDFLRSQEAKAED